MINYRDYGYAGGVGLTDVPVDTTRYGQVYQATHNGRQRLSYMDRSFISFTYGSKHIEDFDVIATITNNRLSRDGYASFRDNVTTYDNLDGQFYWNTHYSTNTFVFNLATDGMDQRKLDDFLNWFSAGVSRELILSEHPNRAIMARVSKPPALSLLPFESEVEMKISNEVYTTKTTMYKGEITLELVSDDPHWYAVDNILGKKAGKRYIDYWTDPNGNEVEIFASQDALKILYEDGIPLGSSIENNMLLGNGAFANVEDNTEQLIWSIAEANIVWDENGIPSGEGARIHGTWTVDGVWDENDQMIEWGYAQRSEQGLTIEDLHGLFTEAGDILQADKPLDWVRTERECAPGDYIGKVAGAIVDTSGNGIVELAPNDSGYFFYAGTAPAPTIISFDLDLLFDESNGKVRSMNNSIFDQPYNSFFIESVEQQELRLTTPSIITSYNKAIDLLNNNYHSGASVPAVKELIIEKIKHPAVRAWVNALIDGTGDTVPSTITSNEIKIHMQGFWQDNNEEYQPMHFSFNSKTGEATIKCTYRIPTDTLSLLTFIYEENAINKLNTIRANDGNLSDEQRYEILETLGWSQYCKDALTDQKIIPTSGDSTSYTRAVQAFCAYVDRHIEEKEAIPTIFRVNENTSSLSRQYTGIDDAGDMLLTNNIIIRERNYPNENGRFLHWENLNETTRRYSHRITHNFPVSIHNLQILYRNMYL